MPLTSIRSGSVMDPSATGSEELSHTDGAESVVVGGTVEVVAGSDVATVELDVEAGTGDASTPVPVAQAETTSDTAAIQRIRHCYPPDAQSVTPRGSSRG